MPATITDKFKRKMLQDLFSSFHNTDAAAGDSDRYYIGLSRSEDWDDDTNPPTPNPSTETIRTFQSSLQAVKAVSDLSYVIPRHNWSAGSVYTAWSNKKHSDTTIGALQDLEGPYYVMTDEHNVYVCLQQGKTDEGVTRNSLYKPTDVTYAPFEAGPDGYVWKFMYNVGVYNSRRYLTSEWIPVEQLLDSEEGGPSTGALSASRLAQVLVQLSAVPGQIYGVHIDSSGRGYTSAPTVTFRGENGDSARGYARIDASGQIFQVVMKDSENAGTYSFGSGYGDQTWIEISGGGGTGAVLTPNVHLDSGGLGNDPRTDLSAAALMYSARIIGDEYNTFNISNDFRQVGLIRNPLKDSVNDTDWVDDSNSTRYVTGVRANALKKLYVGSGIVEENADADNIVTGQVSGAKAILDYYDIYIDSDCCDSTQNQTYNVLYVHQTPATGFTPFDSAETVEVSEGGGSASIVASADSSEPALRWAQMDNFSGEVLYVDNRVQIDRDEDQTEDIKIVIDL